MTPLDSFAGNHDNQALDKVFQFAHVTRPSVGHQDFHRRFGKMLRAAPVGAGEFGQEEIGQREDIL